jgi:hypothetical protein
MREKAKNGDLDIWIFRSTLGDFSLDSRYMLEKPVTSSFFSTNDHLNRGNLSGAPFEKQLVLAGQRLSQILM